MDKKLYTMIVYSENIAGLLNQITAVFTRRQINIESLNVSASSIKGVHKYTITAWTDEETIKKIVRQIEKKIDVLQAHYFTDEEIFAYEIALYKLSTPVFEREPKVSELIRRYNARVVEVNPPIRLWKRTERPRILQLFTTSYRNSVVSCSLCVRDVSLLQRVV